MKVLGFCEGVRLDSGGIGLIGVPGIHRALAERGHRDALAIGGEPMPTAQPILTSSLEAVFDSPDARASGAVSFESYGRWCFAPGLYSAAARVAARADFVTLHSLFSYPVLAGYLLARRFRKPYGLWPHGVLAPIQRTVSPRKKAIYTRGAARRILEAASVLFFSASGERDEIRDLGLQTPSVVIPHGIDLTPFADLPPRGTFRAKHLAGHRGPVVLYLGRLNAKKGLDLLIAAVAKVSREIPDVRLVIAGAPHPPEFERDVREWLAAADLVEIAVLSGLLDEADKVAALADCDVFVMPSVAENFGFAMFEAMACRRAVVCSETLNYADEVRKRDAGLVAPREPDAFAQALVSLLRDPGRRAELGNNGFALAADYSWRSCGERIETALACVLTGCPFPADLQPS